MEVLAELNETYLRPDRRYHPLVEEWVGSRQMYINYAPYGTVPRKWISWPLHFMRQGNVGGLTMAFNWMYSPGPAKDLKLTANQIDAIYRECFKKAVPYFLDGATQTSEMGNVHETTRLVENAKICAVAVEAEFDDELAANLVRRSMQVGLPKTLELLDREANRKSNFDYWFVKYLYKEANSYAKELGMDIARNTNLAEHRLVFQKPD